MGGWGVIKKYIKIVLWILWKKGQVWFRSHLSHAFAFVLGILVLVREGPEIYSMIKNRHLPSGFEWLILIVTLGTIAAAMWDFYGNKLTTSPQEVRFVRAMHLLLNELEIFANGRDKEPDVHKRLEDFTKYFLDLTCYTLCGKKQIDGGLMLALPSTDELELVHTSTNAEYPNGLKIPIQHTEEGSRTGPAGVCFRQLKIVYMPLKRWYLGWPLDLVKNHKERYEPSDPYYGWIEAPKREQENFFSVLCLPVAIYKERGKKESFGVLNFSTRAHDPFVDRDFMMGECFSSILAQAIAIAKAEASKEIVSGKP